MPPKPCLYIATALMAASWCMALWAALQGEPLAACVMLLPGYVAGIAREKARRFLP